MCMCGNVGMKMIVEGSGHRSIIMHKKLKWATSGYGKRPKKRAKWAKRWPAFLAGNQHHFVRLGLIVSISFHRVNVRVLPLHIFLNNVK